MLASAMDRPDLTISLELRLADDCPHRVRRPAAGGRATRVPRTAGACGHRSTRSWTTCEPPRPGRRRSHHRHARTPSTVATPPSRCAGPPPGLCRDRPDDAGFDDARLALNLGVDQRPAAVAFPATRRTRRGRAFAREPACGSRRRAPATTPARSATLEDTILLKTSRMRGVEIDAAPARARVRAGALWEDVVRRGRRPASPRCTAPRRTSASSATRSAAASAGYARSTAWPTNSVTAIELVTADGEHRPRGRDHEPELFWALRGGGGNFGIVTAIEFELFPLGRSTRAAVLAVRARRARCSTPGASGCRAARRDHLGRPHPAAPAASRVPEPVRGKSSRRRGRLHRRRGRGRRAARAAARLGPEIDTFAMVPAGRASRPAHGPADPVPFVGDHRSAR